MLNYKIKLPVSNINQLKIIYSDNERIKRLCDELIRANQYNFETIEYSLDKMEYFHQLISQKIQEEVNKNV